jgi:hypothetical protein
MAMAAAERTDKPVYIVPIVWKYRFVGDVSRRAHREMRLIERALELPSPEEVSVAARFYALQTNILAMRMRRFGFAPPASSADFFECQREFQSHLLGVLASRYHVEAGESIDRTIARFARTIRTQISAQRGTATHATLREDLEMAEEAKRLGEFSQGVYGGAMLTQEQIFESLKRTRDRLMRSGWKNALANMLPRPFGPRVVHIGVPEPIRVTPVSRHERDDYEAALLELTRASMQAKLDEINERNAASVAAYAHPNPFVRLD